MKTIESSRIVPGRYPPPGTSEIADAIRVRRGDRGITPLDAALLHVPPVAGGWNSLLGAVRQQGNLPGDVRELMILRVAAINHAAFEWIHHEHVGRYHGLASAQLYVVRDINTPLPPSTGILSPLQTAALVFADASTREVKVSMTVTDDLMKELEALAHEQEPDSAHERAQDLYVEAAAVVAAYNMVSRFLLAVDVAGMSDDQVPWPIERKEHSINIPSSTNATHTVHAVTLVTSQTAPWIVLANSLLTDLSMWEYLVPFLIVDSPDPLSGKARNPYNILLHSQRGHGHSTLPSQVEPTTIPLLTSDIARLIDVLNIPRPVYSVIGVSQGGAAALAFARSFPDLTRSVVVCDTSPKTPAGNAEAWAARIESVYGGPRPTADQGKQADFASKVGMGYLASATIPRWFPEPSRCSVGGDRTQRSGWVKKMIEKTSVDGFVAGAEALSSYDLLQEDDEWRGLFTSPIERVLCVAGSLDGGGKIGATLEQLKEDWNAVRCQSKGAIAVEYAQIPSAGHLPMIDETEQFAGVLRQFLDNFLSGM